MSLQGFSGLLASFNAILQHMFSRMQIQHFCGLLASFNAAHAQSYALLRWSQTKQWPQMSLIENPLMLPAAALFFVELLLMGWVETKRWQDFRNPGSQGMRRLLLYHVLLHAALCSV